MIDVEVGWMIVSSLSPLLFAVGAAGVFVRRSSLAMMAGILFMIFAAVLGLVGFDLRSALQGDAEASAGQALGVALVIVVAAQVIVAVVLLVARVRIAARKADASGVTPW